MGVARSICRRTVNSYSVTGNTEKYRNPDGLQGHRRRDGRPERPGGGGAHLAAGGLREGVRRGAGGPSVGRWMGRMDLFAGEASRHSGVHENITKPL